MQIQVFTFNQFFENTIIVFDKTKECVIIDPGCYTISEKDTLQKYISINNLIPVKLINTHCHIDHILGNNFIAKTYDLELEMNANDMELIKSSNEIAQLYGFTDYEMSPLPEKFLNEGDTLEFGNSQFKILFTPGHAQVTYLFIQKKMVYLFQEMFYLTIALVELIFLEATMIY